MPGPALAMRTDDDDMVKNVCVRGSSFTGTEHPGSSLEGRESASTSPPTPTKVSPPGFQGNSEEVDLSNSLIFPSPVKGTVFCWLVGWLVDFWFHVLGVSVDTCLSQLFNRGKRGHPDSRCSPLGPSGNTRWNRSSPIGARVLPEWGGKREGDI